MNNLEVQAFNLKDKGRIYLDHNATTPLASDLLPSIHQWLCAWGNPSSIHQSGRGPKALIREARNSLAKALQVSPLEVIFTSGGSEGNNFILKGAVEAEMAKDNPRRTLIISAVEHPSVRVVAEHLASLYRLNLLTVPVFLNGQVDLDFLEKSLSDDVFLVSFMAANNETGHVYPIKKITRMAHKVGARVHTDAVQALGKITVDLSAWDVDYASFSGHKFYAMKGVGLVFVRKNCGLPSLILGGAQERKRRAGTENTLAIASFGQMAKHLSEVQERRLRVAELRDYMESTIEKRVDGVHIHGPEASRLPGTSSLEIEGVDGETLLMNLDIEGVSVSTGAACSSGNPEPSPVLLAMGLSRAQAQRSLRVGLGWGTTKEEVETFIDVLVKVVARVRSL